jgi:hypothetical protein
MMHLKQTLHLKLKQLLLLSLALSALCSVLAGCGSGGTKEARAAGAITIRETPKPYEYTGGGPPPPP